MSNVLIGFNNRGDDATLSADVAFSTSLPATNLQVSNVNTVARTGSIKRSATRFRCALGANYTLRALGIRNHTLSSNGRWRVRVSRSPFDLLFDSEDTGGIVDSRLTKSGGANGTRVNKNGYIVPVTRTNLALQSQTLGTTWTVTGITVTADQTSSPENTTTSDKLGEGTGSSAHTITQTFSATSGTTYAYSFHVKDGDRRYVQLSFASASHGANAWANFDLQEGELGEVGSAVLRAAIEPAGAGHWRILIVAPATATTASGSIDLSLVTSAQATRALSYTGTNKYVYAWGAQLEEGGDWTTYIPTTTVAVQSTESGRINYGTFRTNLLKWSSKFRRSEWTKTRSSVSPDEVTSYDGTNLAGKLVEDTTATNSHLVQQTVAAAGRSEQTVFSVYAKAAGRSRLRMQVVAGADSYQVEFNLSAATTGTPATAGTASGVSASIADAGGGWYRCVLIGTPSTTIGVSVVFSIYLVNDAGTVTYTGDGSSGVYLADAQAEVGASASTYIGTTYWARTVVDSCNGLADEEVRTNLILRSAELDNASWTKVRAAATANQFLSPDGTNSAHLLAEDATAASTHVVYQDVTTAANAAYAYSVVLRANTRARAQLTLSDAGANSVAAIFNLSAGSVTSVANAGTGTGAAGVIEPLGGGWYRCILTGTPAAAGATVRAHVFLVDGAGNPSYSGDGASGLYVWGAQLESGSAATSYIPTTSASVTRAADSVTATGTNLTSWFNASEGSFYAEWILGRDTTSAAIYQVDDGTGNNLIRLRYASGGSGTDAAVIVGGVAQAALTVTGQVTAGTTYRTAAVYRANDFARVNDGSTAVTDDAGSLPTGLTTFRIGQSSLGTEQLNGHIKRITYWPERLKNSELISITTSGPDAIGYNSGWLDALQFTFNGDEPTGWGEQYDLLAVFDAVTAGYATVEFDDLYNTAAYLDLGRLYVMGGLQPAGMTMDSNGFADSRNELSSVSTTVTGRKLGTQRRRARRVAFSLPRLTTTEAETVHELQDECGLLGEVLYVPDPADMELSQRFGGLGLLQELSPIEWPISDNRSTAFRWEEKL
jgi:hypothetical protein